MLMRRGGVFMSMATMFVSRRRVFLRFGVPPVVVIVRGFAVVMGSTFVMRSRLAMMFAGLMFCLGHDVSSLCLSALSMGQYALGDALHGIQRHDINLLAVA
jgi:hypothetical protein